MPLFYFLLFSFPYGNNAATKNTVAKPYRIMQAPQIPCVNLLMRNCISLFKQDQVGIIKVIKKSLQRNDFSNQRQQMIPI